MDIKLKNGQLIYSGAPLGVGELTALLSEHELSISIDDIDIFYTPDELGAQTGQYIYSKYPQTKQNSDLADKMYFETTLKASGNYPDLESKIAHAVADFYASKASGTPKTPAELAASLAAAAGDEVGIEQLIKVGIRVKWVQDCKAAYKTAAEAAQAGQTAQLELPDYPL